MKEGGPACVMQEACLWRAVDPTACRICMTLHDACTARLERGTTLLVRTRVHTRKIAPVSCRTLHALAQQRRATALLEANIYRPFFPAPSILRPPRSSPSYPLPCPLHSPTLPSILAPLHLCRP